MAGILVAEKKKDVSRQPWAGRKITSGKGGGLDGNNSFLDFITQDDLLMPYRVWGYSLAMCWEAKGKIIWLTFLKMSWLNIGLPNIQEVFYRFVHFIFKTLSPMIKHMKCFPKKKYWNCKSEHAAQLCHWWINSFTVQEACKPNATTVLVGDWAQNELAQFVAGQGTRLFILTS